MKPVKHLLPFVTLDRERNPLATLSRNRTPTKPQIPTVDNNLVQPQDLKLRLLLAFLALGITLTLGFLGLYLYNLSDPYTQDVLTLNGNPTVGQAIFEINCAGCHGLHGNGHVGPSLQNIAKHKSKIDLIQQVVSGKTPPMPKFQPNSQEMADLLGYLETL